MQMVQELKPKHIHPQFIFATNHEHWFLKIKTFVKKLRYFSCHSFKIAFAELAQFFCLHCIVIMQQFTFLDCAVVELSCVYWACC
jgi:hypothetical protein